MGISIITVHLNDFSGLEQTSQSLRALLSQTEMQWIVIDGASTPINAEQREVLESARRLSNDFVSEPDSGIYAAMNKGVGLAREQYLLFLNAGDCLHHDFESSQIFGEFQQSHPDMIWGSFDESGKNNQMSNIQPRNKKWLWWGMPTSHQAILFRRELLGNTPYNEDLEIAGDYNLVLKLVDQGASITRTSVSICVVDGTGISNSEQNKALTEQMAVRKLYFGTSDFVNWSVSAAHLAIGWIGQIGLLRKLWK